MDKYAVIGDPIAHSLSPVMQNAGFAALGIDAEYSAVHVKNEGLCDFAEFAIKNLKGFNITVPHKKAIIPFLDTVSEDARLAGSVNTVSVRDGKLHGESTDGYGLATAIEESFGISVCGNSFCFIGCGGAASATAFYFAAKGARSLFFINRTVSKAENLAERIRNSFGTVNVECSPNDDYDKISAFINASAVAVQCTSLGLKNDDPMPLPFELFKKDICYYETIYRETKLLSQARKSGMKTADGRSMLLHQGAKAFSIWTGKDAPVETMRKALYDAIDKRDKNNAKCGMKNAE